jgi:glycosyltransferase involved in cell wall biosynthesis
MRVLIAHNSYRLPGGEDAVVAGERDLLADRGHDVQLFTLSSTSIRGLLHRLRVAWHLPYSTASREVLSTVLESWHPDLVHVHNFFPLLTPAVYDAARTAGIPVVQTLHNYRLICPGALLWRDGHVCEDCLTGSMYRCVLHGCYRGSRPGTAAVARMVSRHRRLGTWSTKVDRFIAPSAFARRKFIEGGLPAQRIVVHPSHCECSRMKDRSSLRSGAIFVGRLSAEKGIETLLRAWRRLDVPLRVIGDGPLLDRARQLATPFVSVLGPATPHEVSEQMQRAQVLIVPSECYETQCRVIAEAYCNRLPVIASRIGALEEAVEDGVTGFLFEPGNPSAIVAQVSRALAREDDLCGLGQNGRWRWETTYSPEASYDRLLRVYSDVVGQRTG